MMKRFTLVMPVSMMAIGMVTAQRTNLAVDVTLTDSELNPIENATVGDGVVGVVEAANLGPDDATDVEVSVGQQGFGNPWWSVSWDGINWVDFHRSFDPEQGIWLIGCMPAEDVYTLLLGFTAETVGEGVLGAYIYCLGCPASYDPDLINNVDEYIIDILEPVSPVSVGEIPIQPTGVQLALAILSVFMTTAGLIIPKIR